MIRRVARLLLVLAMAWLSPALLHAADEVPRLARHVTDLTGTLTPPQVDQLDAQLVALEKSKGAQLVVLMVPTTQPQDIADAVAFLASNDSTWINGQAIEASGGYRL